MKKIISLVLICFAFLSLITACDREEVKSPKINSSEKTSISDDLKRESSFVQRSDAEFEAYYINNPISKIIESDYHWGGSTQDMAEAEISAADIWKDEIYWAYDNLIELASGVKKNQIKNDKKSYIESNESDVKKLLDEYEPVGGSIDRIARAAIIKNYYSSKAKLIYRELYNYNDSFSYYIDSDKTNEENKSFIDNADDS